MKPLDVEKTVEIAALPSVVFAALTDPEQIVRCYPLERVRSEARTGGVFVLEGTAEGGPFVDHGRIEVFEPPHLFQYTYWSDNHGTERLPENHMTIRYTLGLRGEGTVLHVWHGNLLTEQRAEQMELVWDHLLGELRRYCEGIASARAPGIS